MTRTQVDAGIADSVKQFYDDTMKSARDKARPDLIKVLTYKSAAAVEWLQDVFNLDLTLVSRLGYVVDLLSSASSLCIHLSTSASASTT